MPRHHSLINKSAVKSRFASAGFRTSQEVLDHLEALVSVAVRAGIKGMAGRGKKTVSVEEVLRGRLLGDPARKKSPSSDSRLRQVNRGLLRR